VNSALDLLLRTEQGFYNKWIEKAEDGNFLGLKLIMNLIRRNTWNMLSTN
jgi:hypothetical protein